MSSSFEDKFNKICQIKGRITELFRLGLAKPEFQFFKSTLKLGFYTKPRVKLFVILPEVSI